MRRNLAVSAIAVFSVGLGIAATSTMFALVNGNVLKPLPFPEPDRLVTIWNSLPGAGVPQFAQSAALHFTY